MKMKTRKDWGARKRRSVPDTVAPESRVAVMVHHSTGEELGREDCAAWVRQIQAHHMDENEWSDIGYNFLVCQHGDVWEGRGWDAVGAHCSGYNAPAIGVCVLGEYGTGAVPEAAKAAVLVVEAEAERRAGHALDHLGHRDKYRTACPGFELYEWWTGKAAVVEPNRPAPTTPVVRVQAPRFPLPAGRYFGPGSVTRSHYLGQWQRQMRRRWKTGRPYGRTLAIDGLYGPITAATARDFQKDKGLKVDGLIGPKTWAAAFSAPIT